MKITTIVVALLLSSTLFVLPAKAQDIELERVTWLIEPDCLTWATTPYPDRIFARFLAVGFPTGTNPQWELHFAHQTTDLSCPHWIQSWGISGPEQAVFPQINTSLHRAFRFRAKWNCSGGVCADSRDFLFEVPNLDFCLDPPAAPVCSD